MKGLHNLLVAVMMMALGHTYGQDLKITPGDTFVYNGTLATSSDSHEQNGYFINNTADTTNIYWRAVPVTEDSTWQMSFCDPENCYYYSVGMGLGNYGLNHFSAAPGVSYLLRFGVTPNCSADSGKMMINTWLGNDSAASYRTIYYFASYSGSCATAVQSISGPSFRVYPTPVTSNMTVDGLTGLKNVKLSVYDILGNLQIQKTIIQSIDLTNINTDMLHAGVYFLTIESEGSKLLTKRIEKLD